MREAEDISDQTPYIIGHQIQTIPRSRAETFRPKSSLMVGQHSHFSLRSASLVSNDSSRIPGDNFAEKCRRPECKKQLYKRLMCIRHFLRSVRNELVKRFRNLFRDAT
jgi:hypothetical protein